MANLKYRFSKSRTRKRRSQFKKVAPTIYFCPNCGAAVKLHHVCMECGYYRGRQVIEVNRS